MFRSCGRRKYMMEVDWASKCIRNDRKVPVWSLNMNNRIGRLSLLWTSMYASEMLPLSFFKVLKNVFLFKESEQTHPVYTFI